MVGTLVTCKTDTLLLRVTKTVSSLIAAVRGYLLHVLLLPLLKDLLADLGSLTPDSAIEPKMGPI